MQPQASLGEARPAYDIAAEAYWYAAYTCPNHEKKVAEQLDGRGIEQLLPVYHSIRQWKDRKVRLARPLFPGYVFVHIASRERLRVLEIPGVARLVGFGSQPARLPDEDIRSIQCCMTGEVRVEPHPYPCVGRRVRVKNGPLCGLTGIVVRMKNRTRLVLSIDLIRSAATVEAEQVDLEPIQ
jgi:transcription antitermination factor NusG